MTDTTTAAGEMVLYTIANIAQFERKQTSERIVANFQARAERGLFNGGSVPFGFKRNPDKKGYLFVDENEADVVREAYKTFINEGCLSKTGKSLNERGFRLTKLRSENGGQSRLEVFTIDNLHDLLTNQRYVGLRNYKSRSGEVKTSKACWSSIVDDEIFKQVQHILKKNRHSLKTSSSARYPYQLSGMTFCGICHDSLIGKSANGNSGKVAYYEHSRITKNQSCLTSKVFSCRPDRFQAKKIEPNVWQNVLSLLLDPKVAEDLISEAQSIHKSQSHVTETDKLRNKIHGIDGQLELLPNISVRFQKEFRQREYLPKCRFWRI